MLDTAIDVAFTVDLLLIALAALSPVFWRCLPLGGKHIVQIAILLLCAIVSVRLAIPFAAYLDA